MLQILWAFEICQPTVYTDLQTSQSLFPSPVLARLFLFLYVPCPLSSPIFYSHFTNLALSNKLENIYLFIYEAGVFLCCCPETHSLEKAGLELNNPPASDFQVQVLRVKQRPKCLKPQHLSHERLLNHVSVKSQEGLSQIIELPQLWQRQSFLIQGDLFLQLYQVLTPDSKGQCNNLRQELLYDSLATVCIFSVSQRLNAFFLQKCNWRW